MKDKKRSFKKDEFSSQVRGRLKEKSLNVEVRLCVSQRSLGEMVVTGEISAGQWSEKDIDRLFLKNSGGKRED